VYPDALAMLGTSNGYKPCPRELKTQKAYDFYRTRYLLVWTFGFGVFFTSIGILVWAIFSTLEHDSPFHDRGNHPYRAAILYTVSAICFVFFVLMRLGPAQLRSRAGSGLLFGIAGNPNSFAPASVQDVQKASRELRMRGERADIVGGAWSNVLRCESSSSVCIHTRRMVGRNRDAGKYVWFAGTQLMDVQKELAKEGKQIINMPSYGSVTVGAWIATQGHGMTGASTSYGRVAAKARVLDLLTGIETDDGQQALLEKFGVSRKASSQYIILWVSLDDSAMLGPNTTLVRSHRLLSTTADAEWLLSKDARMAVVFVGNTKALAARWLPAKGVNVNKGGALFDTWLTVFAVTGWGSLIGDPSTAQKTETVQKAAMLFHTYLYPSFIYFYLLFGVVNFEAYTTDVPVTPATLLSLTQTLKSVHAAHGGRSEVRVQGKLLYVDGFAWSRAGQRATFAALFAIGVKRCALHPGKYEVLSEDVSCSGVEIVAPRDVK